MESFFVFFSLQKHQLHFVLREMGGELLGPVASFSVCFCWDLGMFLFLFQKNDRKETQDMNIDLLSI